MSKKDDALDDLYLCSMELALFLVSKPRRMTAAKTAEMEKLLAACAETRDAALDAGATAAQLKEVINGAEEDAGLIEEMVESGMKITVEI